MKILGIVLAGVVVGYLLGTAYGAHVYSEVFARAGILDRIAMESTNAGGSTRQHYGWVGSIVGAVLGLIVGLNLDSKS